MVRVKTVLNGDIRRFNLGTEPSYAALEERIGQLYGITDFKLLYKDDEGDAVTMNSDAELAEAVETVGANQPLRVEIVPKNNRSSASGPGVSGAATAAVAGATRTETAPPSAAAGPSTATNRNTEAGPSSAPNPTPEAGGSERQGAPPTAVDDPLGVMGFVNEILDACGVGANFGDIRGRGMGMRGAWGGRGCGYGRGRGGWRPHHEWVRTWQMNEAEFRNMLENLDVSGLGGDFSSISNETMQALRQLVEALMSQPGPGALMRALPVALPTVRAFLAELGNNAGAEVSAERIDALAAALQAVLTHPLGAANAARVGEFARTAGRDPAVIRVLRRVAGVGASFNMDTAMRDAGVTGGRLDEQTFPWEAEAGRSLVPRPTLRMGSSGSEVRFLQHLLTNLGYMTPQDYSIRSGFYGPRTASAVARFRSEFGLPEPNSQVYDEIAAASMMSIVDAGVPPSASAGSATVTGAETGAETQSNEEATA